MSETLQKPKRTRQPKTEPVPCYVYDNCEEDDLQSVRKYVCRDLGTTQHTDGKHYCLLHLPTKDKDVDKEFEKEFRKRLHEHDAKIANIEAEFPNDKEKQLQTIREKGIINNFSYIWFPSRIDLKEHNFKATTSFRLATFSATASFISATFSGYTDFSSVNFSESSSFKSAKFSTHADFNSAIFSLHADFSLAIFSAVADFSSATFSASASFRFASFSAHTDFLSTTFSGNTDFRAAKFEETSQIIFENTRFCSDVIFPHTEFDGYVEFIGEIFLDADAVKKVKDELKNERIKDGQSAFFNLAKARLNKPERISFNSMKLHPTWFVRTDVRNLNFNNVEWLNLEIDIDRSGLDAEINLNKRHRNQPKEPLIKAFNQLADNAKANRRFEESKLFRKQIIALLEKPCQINDVIKESKKDEIRANVCKEYPVVNEVEGKFYCLWHNPDVKKAETFIKELEKRKEYQQTDFRYVWFPSEVNFESYVFENIAKFDFATFYLGANFYKAIFQKDVDFYKTTFNFKTDFTESTFKGEANFKTTKFEGDSRTYFNKTKFEKKLDLSHSNIKGYFYFEGDNKNSIFLQESSLLTLRRARIDDAKKISFHTVLLRPNWFVNVDSRGFIFTDIDWKNIDADYRNKNIKHECRSLEEQGIKEQKKRLLEITCRQLAVNAEENNRYDEAAKFRYMAMETKRLEDKSQFFLFWLYKQSSEYGESWIRAFYWLVLIWVYFAFVYWLIGEFQENKPVGFLESFGYSLQVMILQKPELRPFGWFTILYYGLESILAPLQAALLALAIRRKFMR